MKIEDYIKMRNENRYDLNLFWSYYKDNGGSIHDVNKFQQYFLNDTQEINTHMGNMQIMRGERDKNEILIGFDKKLGLTSLYDENNNLIRVWK